MLDNIFLILKEDSQTITLQLASENHPIFQAHFPNNPVLPAFVLIDIVAKILNDYIVYIRTSKFLAPISPNDILRCQIEKNVKQRKVTIFKNEVKVSEISYESK